MAAKWEERERERAETLADELEALCWEEHGRTEGLCREHAVAGFTGLMRGMREGVTEWLGHPLPPPPPKPKA